MSALDEVLHGYMNAQLKFLQRRDRAGRIRQIGERVMSNSNEDKEPKNEMIKPNTQTIPLDGFTGFEDGVEGDDQPQGGGVIKGRIIKFTNEFSWVTNDGEELLPSLELVAVDIARLVQKWINQKPEETIIVLPGQKFPDVQAMNEKAPRSEWREDLNRKMVGPWQMQYLVYLLDLQTLDRFTYPTATVGGGIAVRDLADKTKWVRKFRGPNVNAVVTLSDTFMKNRFGGRQRPHFIIKRWIGLDAEGALAAPKLLVLEGGATAKPEPTVSPTQPGIHEVNEPTLSEELNDDLPF